MRRIGHVVVSYLLGLVFFAFFYLVAHLRPVSGLDLKVITFDYVNLINWILFYPFARNWARRWRLARQAKKANDSRGFIRQAYDEHGESFAQMEYNTAWGSHGSPNGGAGLVSFILYAGVYIFAVLIDVGLLISSLTKHIRSAHN